MKVTLDWLKWDRWIGIKGLVAAFFFAHGLEVSAAQLPIVLTPLEASKSVKKLPDYVGFGYSGVAFYSNKLYASCNIGLLEIENGSVRKAYQWNKSDSVVEGPWFDLANRKLWVWLPGGDRLANFDAQKWQSIPMPKPKYGYVSRGDVLSGYRGASGTDDFWLEGAGNAWAWNESQQKWKDPVDSMSFTNGNRRGRLKRVFLLGNKPLIVVRYVESWEIQGGARGGQLVGDTFHQFDDGWRLIADNSGKSFFSEQVVSVKGSGFIRTVDGEILQAVVSGVSKVESPGWCESLAATSAGTLLASFRDLGVHEFVDGWRLRFKAPYPLNEGENWVHLAESDGRIAMATHPVSHFKDGKRIATRSTAGLWLFDGKGTVKVEFPLVSNRN